ncbi:hypothetical protein, partial [Ferrimicrobium sp.]
VRQIKGSYRPKLTQQAKLEANESGRRRRGIVKRTTDLLRPDRLRVPADEEHHQISQGNPSQAR